MRDQVAGKGMEVFLPTVNVWSSRGARRHLTQAPLFPGYLFVRDTMDKASYIEVRKSNGLVAVLGQRWDQLEVVPDSEIEALQRTLHAGLPVLPNPFLREGQRVRISRGPLADVEGIFLRSNLHKGLLVISITMLRRSVAVEVDCSLVAAA